MAVCSNSAYVQLILLSWEREDAATASIAVQHGHINLVRLEGDVQYKTMFPTLEAACTTQNAACTLHIGSSSKSACRSNIDLRVIMQHLPIAESKAAFPLVIFSHGIGGNRMAYSAIICSLVRQVSTYTHRHTAAIICSLVRH